MGLEGRIILKWWDEGMDGIDLSWIGTDAPLS
jgi:hypothetical protein